MCGVTGFFVGCAFASICKSGQSACALLSPSELVATWYTTSAARRSPRRVLKAEDVEAPLFPAELAPVLSHPAIAALDAGQRRAIQNNHLFRYLDFTAKLEMVVVNDVLKDLVFGHFPFDLTPEAILCAHQIYVDEAYHALFSVDLLQQASAELEITPVLPVAPRFLHVLRAHLAKAEDEKARRLIRLFFVIVSETLITTSLSHIRQDAALPQAVRAQVSDHARDEARHQRFFATLLAAVWPHLNQADRLFCLSHVPDFVLAFVAPDRSAIVAEIVNAGVSRDDAEGIVAETYTDAVVAAYAKRCSAFLRQAVGAFDEAQAPVVVDRFSAAGLA